MDQETSPSRGLVKINFKFPISVKLLMVYILLLAIALGGGSLSLIVANRNFGDAAAINISGSLRMMSYRIALEMQDDVQPDLLIDMFDNQLHNPDLTSVILDNIDHVVFNKYQSIEQQWIRMQQDIRRKSTQNYLDNLPGFVASIDSLVSELQLMSETRINWFQHTQQVIVILLSIISVGFILLLRRNFIEPLQTLSNMARNVRKGNFQLRSQHTSHDEIGLLSNTFNQMSEDLDSLYKNMEDRVNKKTETLTRTIKSLEFLYGASQNLSSEPGKIFILLPDFLEELTGLLELDAVHFCDLREDKSSNIWVHKSNSEMYQCSVHPCILLDSTGAVSFNKNETYFPVRHDTQIFGALKIHTQQPVWGWKYLLLETTTEMLSSFFRLDSLSKEVSRNLLFEERTLIARELHDSLAQLLSYQKIQISGLKRFMPKDADKRIKDILIELDDSMDASYKRVRELITTFRIQGNQSSLESTFSATIEEFNRYSLTIISGDFDLNFSLEPGQEVHVIHIIREALLNVVKHSHAKHCHVDISGTPVFVELIVEDDGIGIDPDIDFTGHYGLTILKERAEKLDGCIDFMQNKPGTKVKLSFSPIKKLIEITEGSAE